MKNMSTRSRVLIIVILIVVIGCLQYLSSLGMHREHIFLRQILFVPIILAGLWFGFKGALPTSLCISIIYTPHIIVTWDNFSPEDLNKLVAILLYNIAAVLIGLLVDKERAQHDRLRKAENLAAMGKAVSTIAHDMKTPLIAIGGFTLNVQKKMKKDAPDYQKLEIVVTETKRLEQMVREMLDFSKPLKLHRSSGNIHKVIQESIAVVAETANNRKVKLEVDFHHNLPEFFFDSMRMEQVVINLLINAVQASPEGETVIVRTSINGSSASIDVKDCGCGIPTENKEQIFFPFFTTKKEGTGLGLPIVKKIVEAHAGFLEPIDNPDKGVTFRITLPVD